MNAEQLKRWRESGREMLTAEGSPATINDEQRTVDVVWFTGVDVPRTDWWTGASYMLHFDPAGADLSLLNVGAPVFDNHNSYEGSSGQLGRVDRAWAQDGKYLATLRFKRSTDATGPRPDVDGLWQDIKDGICTKYSMGVEILESTEERDASEHLISKTATKWRPFELSLAPVPADFGTTTLSGRQPQVNSASLRQRERDIEIIRVA